MTELERLLVSSDDELERALLGAVVAEAPSSAGLRDTALALGLATSTSAVFLVSLPTTAANLGVEATSVTASLGATATATSAATASVAASSVAATAGVASLATLGKSLVGGALVSFLALTTVDHTFTASSVERPRVTATPAAPGAQSLLPPPSRRASSHGAASDAPTPAEAVVAAVVEPSARRSSRGASRRPLSQALGAPTPNPAERPAVTPPAPPANTAPSAASLAAETRLLDRARAALARGETAAAQQLLSQYDAARPSAVLALEAALLRVRLLLATGQRSAAAEQARQLIALYPGNAHAESLRRLAAE
jgi:hypothetical protein